MCYKISAIALCTFYDTVHGSDLYDGSRSADRKMVKE